jgi:excisionase family DNA binding protein
LADPGAKAACLLTRPFDQKRGPSVPNEEILKLRDVAALLKVGEKTVYSMAQTGELPAFKVRGQWRFSRKDIDAWIEQQKHTTQDFGEDDQK